MEKKVEVKKKWKIKCHHCGHTWQTGTKFVYATCPSCLFKVKVKRD